MFFVKIILTKLRVGEKGRRKEEKKGKRRKRECKQTTNRKNLKSNVTEYTIIKKDKKILGTTSFISFETLDRNRQILRTNI